MWVETLADTAQGQGEKQLEESEKQADSIQWHCSPSRWDTGAPRENYHCEHSASLHDNPG